METGAKIKMYRKRSGMTSSELAKKTYLSPASICNYEKKQERSESSGSGINRKSSECQAY